MITHSTVAYGHSFGAAVSKISMVVIRKNDSASGMAIAVDVETWATESASTAGADKLFKRKVVFADTFRPTMKTLHLPLNTVFRVGVDKFKSNGKVTLAIEEALITLPEWSGGVIT